MDYPVLAGCGLTRLDAAKVLPPVLLVCQRGCKRSANPLQEPNLLPPCEQRLVGQCGAQMMWGRVGHRRRGHRRRGHRAGVMSICRPITD